MFTGLITEVGEIISGSGELPRMKIRSAEVRNSLGVGDSVAINGACFTVTALGKDSFSVDVSRRTLRLTSFEKLRQGVQVNLEAALKVGDRVGGHFVSGHIDGVGMVRSVGRRREDFWFSVQLPPGLESFVFEGCSIAIDGISLTVGGVKGRDVEFYIIPHTYESTNIRTYRSGTYVNVEADFLAKHVQKLMTSTHRERQVRETLGLLEQDKWERTK